MMICKFFQVIKIIKFCAEMRKPMLEYIGIPMWVFQPQPWNSEARESTIMYLKTPRKYEGELFVF